MNIGKSVRIAMIRRDFTAGEVAERTGLSKRFIQNICRQTSCSTVSLEKIAEAFDMSVSELIALGETR